MMTFIAVSPAEAFLREHGIDNVTVTETRNGMFALINTAFEADFAEYTISHYMNREYSNPAMKEKNIESIAEHYAATVMESAILSLRGSPLISKGKNFLSKLSDAPAFAVQKHIQILKNPESVENFIKTHQKELNDQRKIREKLANEAN